jgi:biotin carboxyl carrier protein
MEIYISEKNNLKKFEVIENNGLLEISNGKKAYQVDLKLLDKNLFSLMINNQSYTFEAVENGKEIKIILNQHEYSVPVLNHREKIEEEILGSSSLLEEKGEIRAPMPGLVLKIEVQKGNTVAVGQPLIIMEAMKMENEIRSQIDGKIQEVKVTENQKVEKDDLLLRIG